MANKDDPISGDPVNQMFDDQGIDSRDVGKRDKAELSSTLEEMYNEGIED